MTYTASVLGTTDNSGWIILGRGVRGAGGSAVLCIAGFEKSLLGIE